MENTAHTNVFSVGIIIAGLVISAASAIVPEYTHYKMMFSVLSAGVLPYVIYAFAAAYLKPALSIGVGFIILAIHAGLVVNERFTENIDYSSGAIYYAPVVITLLLIPLLVMSARKPWHR
ncbi:MAG: hypothetical protein PVG89_15850 [Gammaproteobacteria bacterium]|jgi:hypothetical protein